MRILFISSTRIGDGILSTGLLAWLLDRYPEAHLTIACGPAVAPLYTAVPRLERVIELRKRRWAGHWLSLWARCVGHRWTLIVDLRRSAMRYVLMSRRRLSMPADRPGRHKVVQISEMIGRADAPLAPVIWTTEAHQSAARRLVPDGAPVLALAPTANWGGKEWPTEHFQVLVRLLTGVGGLYPGARVAVFSAPDERERAVRVLEAVPVESRIDLAGRTDLLTAYACLGRAQLFIGNDSALMHMAAASGVPTLGLFGPSREEQYGPWGPRTAVVRTPESFEEIVAAPGYDHRSHASRMSSLSVDAVAAAAEALWRRAASIEAG